MKCSAEIRPLICAKGKLGDCCDGCVDNNECSSKNLLCNGKVFPCGGGMKDDGINGCPYVVMAD